jgi:hypothetical protein
MKDVMVVTSSGDIFVEALDTESGQLSNVNIKKTQVYGAVLVANNTWYLFKVDKNVLAVNTPIRGISWSTPIELPSMGVFDCNYLKFKNDDYIYRTSNNYIYFDDSIQFVGDFAIIYEIHRKRRINYTSCLISELFMAIYKNVVKGYETYYLFDSSIYLNNKTSSKVIEIKVEKVDL